MSQPTRMRVAIRQSAGQTATIARPIAAAMKSRGRARTMRIGLGRWRCGRGCSVMNAITTRSPDSASSGNVQVPTSAGPVDECFLEQLRPLLALVEELRKIDEDQLLRRRLHARVGRNGLPIRQDSLRIGQVEIQQQK